MRPFFYAMKEITERNMTGTEILHENGTDFAIETVADVSENLRRNVILQNHTSGYSPSKDMKHIASIPLVVVAEWNRIHGVDVMRKENRALLKRLLNDSDNRMFRTSLGRF